MPLARVGVRTDSTMGLQLQRGRGQFPRTRIGVVRRMHGILGERERPNMAETRLASSLRG